MYIGANTLAPPMAHGCDRTAMKMRPSSGPVATAVTRNRIAFKSIVVDAKRSASLPAPNAPTAQPSTLMQRRSRSQPHQCEKLLPVRQRCR